MSPIIETQNKRGIGLIGKALSLSKHFPVLQTLPLALVLCLQPISVNAAQFAKTMSSLNAQQIAALLQQQGVAKEKIPTMTAIALAESGGRPQAFNPQGLDKSYGLWQVNMHGGLGPARMKQFGLKSEQELFDPTTNVKAAKQILGSQGLGAWSVYKSGKYKEFLPQAQKASQGLDAVSAEQKPQEISTASPGGRTFIVYGDGEPTSAESFLNDYIKRSPKIDTGINPLAMLAQAFETPNYLG